LRLGSEELTVDFLISMFLKEQEGLSKLRAVLLIPFGSVFFRVKATHRDYSTSKHNTRH
jgi:hypothetical protein